MVLTAQTTQYCSACILPLWLVCTPTLGLSEHTAPLQSDSDVYIPSLWTPHSLYPVSPDPAFTISALPGPCIHYIRSPRTLHSLYPLSPDPA
ncbi:unnamed protein product [Staurois parvus]|uniref:Uncharacterized protein n=1 Tax=Staurois parvus TaxID=386267 RepID=A0ABN9D5Q1_9NEOB|nr:unnamed protein product [Staurois parvus]